MSKCSFAFLVLVYNHENYIIEHLESIKFLVQNYAQDINVKLIINDDCSQDQSVSLINAWVTKNKNLFYDIKTIFNEKNIGTCESILNMLKYASTDALKLTAGDDVYSFENIFEYAFLKDNCCMATGIPLNLTDAVLTEKKVDTFNAIATQVIYRSQPLLNRFKYLSYNNAPNIIHNKMQLIDFKVNSVLRNYSVVEDWPLQIAIAEQYPESIMTLVPKVFVYYRRTSGSTYLIKKNDFYYDKISAYNYLITIETNFFSRLLISSRLMCFKISNRYVNKLLNLGFYHYISNIILNFVSIKRNYSTIDLKLVEHQQHHQEIIHRSSIFLNYMKRD